MRGIRLLLVLSVFGSNLPWALAQTQAGFNFKILQLNTWMLKAPIVRVPIAKDIKARALILPEVVSNTGADIIVFQEVWPKAIRNQIAGGLRKRGYPYSASFSHGGFIRGILGNGLFIVSKFPLDSRVTMMRFRHFTRDDEFFAYKGAIKTRVNIPNVGFVDLYDSHLGAVSFDSAQKEYDANQELKKTEQAKELVQFIDSTKTGAIQILSADLNSHYKNFEGGVFTQDYSDVYKLMTDPVIGEGMVDTYHALNGFPANPDCTYCMDNIYAALGLFGNAPSEVEDYIFMSPNSQITAESSQIVLKEDLNEVIDPRPYGLQTVPVHISDHYGVMTTFRVATTHP